MTDLTILDEYRENNAWVIVFQDGDEVFRLITDSFLNEWLEVVA